ncbi:MAG: asparagine synthase (glutamine-hydrolyzing) [Gemmatimonadales bacterium]
MCGIAGFVTRSYRATQSDALVRALDRLRHRGPDDEGHVTLPAPPGDGAPCVGLGNRRLAILDLSPASHQPMVSRDGRWTLVYNGELYNYRELRAELERLGHAFRSPGDTEVLLSAFAEWGIAALPRLVGMFAFAIHDAREGRVTLVRDPFGIKPLYYAVTEDTLVFASEIAAILEFPRVSRTVDPRRYYDFLATANTDSGGGTLFADIRQLPGAHYLEVRLDTPASGQPVRWWNLDLDRELDVSFATATTMVREAFLDSMRFHLRSDVPLGFSLSGGIDSSAVVSSARHLLGSAAELHTFSYVPADPLIDERRFSDAVIQSAGTVAHTLSLGPEELRRDIDRLSGIQAEPFASPVIYAQYRLLGMARDAGMKVMLGGQGADEMLAGYDRYLPARLASLLRQGHWLRAVRSARGAVTPYSAGTLGALRIAAANALPGWLVVPTRERWRQLRKKAAWLDHDWFAERGVAPTPLWSARGPRVMRAMLDHNLRESQIQALLRYEDRNAMSYSLENRVPFLTPALVQLLFSLPEEYLLAENGTRKAVFRQAMRGIVPDLVLDRRDKLGFSVPSRSWFEALDPWIGERLEHMGGLPGVRAEEVRRRWRGEGRPADPYMVWRCVSLSTWAERFNVQFV